MVFISYLRKSLKNAVNKIHALRSNSQSISSSKKGENDEKTLFIIYDMYDVTSW